jgi:hypothetical protein
MPKHVITFQRTVTERASIEVDLAPGVTTDEVERGPLIIAQLDNAPRTSTDSGWRVVGSTPPLNLHAIRGGRLLCGASVMGEHFVGHESDETVTCPRCAEIIASDKAKVAS